MAGSTVSNGWRYSRRRKGSVIWGSQRNYVLILAPCFMHLLCLLKLWYATRMSCGACNCSTHLRDGVGRHEGDGRVGLAAAAAVRAVAAVGVGAANQGLAGESDRGPLGVGDGHGGLDRRHGGAAGAVGARQGVESVGVVARVVICSCDVGGDCYPRGVLLRCTGDGSGQRDLGSFALAGDASVLEDGRVLMAMETYQLMDAGASEPLDSSSGI